MAPMSSMLIVSGAFSPVSSDAWVDCAKLRGGADGGGVTAPLVIVTPWTVTPRAVVSIIGSADPRALVMFSMLLPDTVIVAVTSTLAGLTCSEMASCRTPANAARLLLKEARSKVSTVPSTSTVTVMIKGGHSAYWAKPQKRHDAWPAALQPIGAPGARHVSS